MVHLPLQARGREGQGALGAPAGRVARRVTNRGLGHDQVFDFGHCSWPSSFFCSGSGFTCCSGERDGDG